jgi:hypothetical protein
MEYFMRNPCFGIRFCLMWKAVSPLTARIASLMLFLAILSRIHSRSGLLTMGKRVLGLVQLNGLSLVANPPARITAFS